MTACGASKFSKYVGAYFRDKYAIPDHRGDVKYSTWDRWENYCEQFEKGEHLIETYDKKVLEELLKDKYYNVFISVDGTCNSSSEGVCQFLNSQGIYADNANGIWVVQAGTIISGTNGGDCEQYINTKQRDFCIHHKMETNSNEVFIDNEVCEKKVTNGVNIIVYDSKTNIIVDTFGINYDDNCSVVR